MSWFDSPGDIAAIAAVIAAVFGILIYLIKAETSKIAEQVRPNHGTSMHDLITEQGKRLDVAIGSHADIMDRIADLHATNDAAHDTLADMVRRVSHRLDTHASSPEHDRRGPDSDR